MSGSCGQLGLRSLRGGVVGEYVLIVFIGVHWPCICLSLREICDLDVYHVLDVLFAKVDSWIHLFGEHLQAIFIPQPREAARYCVVVAVPRLLTLRLRGI